MPLNECPVALVAQANTAHRLTVDLDIRPAVLVVDPEVTGQTGACGFLAAKMTACGGVGDQVPERLTHSLSVQPHIGRWLQLGPFLRFDPNMDIDDVV